MKTVSIQTQNNIYKHRVGHLPVASLRVGGGKQDLAPEELKAKWRKTVLDKKLVRINLINIWSAISYSIEDLLVKSL